MDEGREAAGVVVFVVAGGDEGRAGEVLVAGDGGVAAEVVVGEVDALLADFVAADGSVLAEFGEAAEVGIAVRRGSQNCT